jgi:hypothetical protein
MNFRRLLPVPLLVVWLTLPCRAQEQKPFPTNGEIQLLVTQADRAMGQYQALIDQDLVRANKKNADAIATDRGLIHAIETAVKALRTNPQGFNGPAGFAFFEWLDDASRNAVLYSQAALSDASLRMMAGDEAKAAEQANLSRRCMDISTLIYTVSENAGSLYDRYLRAEEQLSTKTLSVAQQCADTLKKADSAKKQ